MTAAGRKRCFTQEQSRDEPSDRQQSGFDEADVQINKSSTRSRPMLHLQEIFHDVHLRLSEFCEAVTVGNVLMQSKEEVHQLILELILE